MIEILVLIILILINGIFSATEIAFLSINKYELNKEVKKNNKRAKKIVNLLNDSSSFLSAIQIAITLSGFLASAFAAENFASELADIITVTYISKETLTNILIVLITMLLSYFTLVFGELVPKKIGLAYSYKICFQMVNIINIIIKIFKPFINILKYSTDFIVKIFKIKVRKETSEDEIKDSIIDSSLEDFEKELLLNVFEFNDVTLKEVMTPKKDVISIDVTSSLDEIKEKIVKYKYTRYPITKDNNVIGVLNIKDLIVNNKNSFKIKDYVRKVVKLNSDMVIDDAFLYLNSLYEPFAVVKENNEYIGIITIEDIIENVIGNVFDEYDDTEE